MGQSYSWENKQALDCLNKYYQIWGKPYIFVDKPGGLAIWESWNLKNKKIFGFPVCFNNVIIRDEFIPHHDCGISHHDFIHISVHVPISLDQQRNLIIISECIGADRKNGMLWARCNSVPKIIVILKLATDSMFGQNITPAHLKNSLKRLEQPDSEKYIYKSYVQLCKNVHLLKTTTVSGHTTHAENFSTDPWYADGGYTSNHNEVIDDMDRQNKMYYDMLDEWMHKKNTSLKPEAYPKAPGVKPSMENFLGLGEILKKQELMSEPKNPSCIGACAERYYKTVENFYSDSQLKTAVDQHLKNVLGSEDFIPFSAYNKYTTPQYKEEILANSENMSNFKTLTNKLWTPSESFLNLENLKKKIF